MCTPASITPGEPRSLQARLSAIGKHLRVATVQERGKPTAASMAGRHQAIPRSVEASNGSQPSSTRAPGQTPPSRRSEVTRQRGEACSRMRRHALASVRGDDDVDPNTGTRVMRQDWRDEGLVVWVCNDRDECPSRGRHHGSAARGRRTGGADRRGDNRAPGPCSPVWSRMRVRQVRHRKVVCTAKPMRGL